MGWPPSMISAALDNPSRGKDPQKAAVHPDLRGGSDDDIRPGGPGLIEQEVARWAWCLHCDGVGVPFNLPDAVLQPLHEDDLPCAQVLSQEGVKTAHRTCTRRRRFPARPGPDRPGRERSPCRSLPPLPPSRAPGCAGR